MRQSLKQLQLLPERNLKSKASNLKSFGGILRNTRKGRQGSRPLATKSSMHLVLRSSKAKGAWSLKHGHNHQKIREIFWKFSQKYGVRIFSLANVGNHLHVHLQLSTRQTYKKFICAVTAAIVMQVTKAKAGFARKKSKHERFWDYRPFTRILNSWTEVLRLKDYIAINKMEGFGIQRAKAIAIIRQSDKLFASNFKIPLPS